MNDRAVVRLVTLDRARPQLPTPPTALVGREREVAAAQGLLARPEVRLVTLTGPGGIGKTRLVLEVAGAIAEEGNGDVWFVSLADLRDPGLVLPTVAHALGVREEAARSLGEAVAAFVGEQRALLVLDNFEQVLEAAPGIADLLAVCPRLRVLATSRSPLGLRSEQVFPVGPLALPPTGGSPTTASVAQSPAVALFVQRAQAVDPRFELTAANAAAVAEICARLDGMPLAVELAAARIRLLSPQALLARMTGRLALLSGGPRDLPARHQTLRDAIAWSYDLLTAQEQALFRLMAVFMGGRTLAAVEAVVEGVRRQAPGASETPTTGAWDLAPSAFVLDAIASLVDKSLVCADEEPDGEVRFTLYQAVQEFGRERLDAAGEAPAAMRAHAAYYVGLAEEAEPALVGPEQAIWFERLESEHDNVRAALGWATGDGSQESGVRGQENGGGGSSTAVAPLQSRAEMGLRLAGAMWRFWAVRGYLGEGRAWLERTLEQTAGATEEDGVVRARAKALQHLGNMDLDLGDYEGARERYEESLALRRGLGDESGVAASLNGLGLLAGFLGDYERAASLHEEALTLRRRSGDRQGLGNSLTNLGNVAAVRGDLGRARELHEEALRVREGMRDEGAVTYARLNLGDVARLGGDVARARGLFEESLRGFLGVGDKLGIGYALHRLGSVAGTPAERAARFAEALTLRRELGDRRGVAECLEGIATVVAEGGEARGAARLLGAADGLRASLGAVRSPAEETARAGMTAALRTALGDVGLREAMAAKGGPSTDEAIEEALAVAARVGTGTVGQASAVGPAPVGSLPAGLSEREGEVLRFAAAGLTNAQIAERLFISPRTVNAHLTTIYRKLEVTSRSAATRYALDHGLA